MNSETQQKIKTVLGVITVVVLVFLSYGATDYLRSELVVNPVDYDRFDIVILGDSITEGLGTSQSFDYVSLLRSHTGLKIRNSGIRNDKTGDALLRIEEDVLAHDPDVVVIFLGGNDYINFIPKEEIFSNLRRIIQILKDKNIEVLLLGVQGGVFYDLYEEDFQLLSIETDVSFIPNILEGVIGNPKLMKDLLHPNDAGHRAIFDRVAPELDRIIKKYY
jgi:acyl-CoA thioesterase I